VRKRPAPVQIATITNQLAVLQLRPLGYGYGGGPFGGLVIATAGELNT
jgi:hypothetical protein